MSQTSPSYNSFPENSSSIPPNPPSAPQKEHEVPLETAYERLKRRMTSEELPPEVREVLNASGKRAQRLGLIFGCGSALGVGLLSQRYKASSMQSWLFTAGAAIFGMEAGKIIGAALGARDMLRSTNPEVHRILQEFKNEIQQTRQPHPSPPSNSAWEKIRKQNTESSSIPVSIPPPTLDPVSLPKPLENDKKAENAPQKIKKYNQYGDEIE